MEIRAATREEIESAQAVGTPLPLVRLALDMNSCATATEMEDNYRATLARGYEPLNDLIDKHSGTCSLVGSGPTIRETYKDLRGDVIAVNSAIGFLLDHGVIPKYAMLWDAADIVSKFAVPHPDVTYLVASRCHPSVFERLKDCKVIVWHAAGDHHIKELVKNEAPEPYPVMVMGGTAGVTRGVFLIHLLGYRDIHIFGGDSSYGTDGNTHVRGSLVPEKDTMVSIGYNPPIWFRTTPEWAQQVNEYQTIFAMFTMNDAVNLHVHGENTMLKCMHDLLTAKKAFQGQEKFVADIMGLTIRQHDLNEKASRGEFETAPTPKTTQPLEESKCRNS